MNRARASRSVSWGQAVVRTHGLSEIPDQDLVRRASAGDAWAEEALFRKHVDFIAALATRLLGRRDDADDVVQDTFIAAFGGLEGFHGTAPFRSWLAGIAVHQVHRRFRRRKLLAVLGLHRSSHGAMLEARSRSDTTPEARDELRRLDETLSTLPDVERAAWILRYVEGYSLEETARLCETSLTTVKRRILRAHNVVRARVDIEEATDE